jgi:hypothetical protein
VPIARIKHTRVRRYVRLEVSSACSSPQIVHTRGPAILESEYAFHIVGSFCVPTTEYQSNRRDKLNLSGTYRGWWARYRKNGNDRSRERTIAHYFLPTPLIVSIPRLWVDRLPDTAEHPEAVPISLLEVLGVGAELGELVLLS